MGTGALQLTTQSEEQRAQDRPGGHVVHFGDMQSEEPQRETKGIVGDDGGKSREVPG